MRQFTIEYTEKDAKHRLISSKGKSRRVVAVLTSEEASQFTYICAYIVYIHKSGRREVME